MGGTNGNPVKISIPIYSKYYRNLNTSHTEEFNIDKEFHDFLTEGTLSYIGEVITDDTDSIAGTIEMYKFSNLNGKTVTFERGEKKNIDFDGSVPQLSLSEIMLGKICRKGQLGVKDIYGEPEDYLIDRIQDGAFDENAPHIKNITFDDTNNTGLCHHLHDDFCVDRMGSWNDDISINVYSDSYCSGGPNCNFDYDSNTCTNTNISDIDNITKCTFNPSNTQTSIENISANNCNSNWMNICGMINPLGETLGCRGVVRTIYQLFDDGDRDNYDNNINNLLEQNNIDIDTENLVCSLSNSWTQHTGLGDGCSDNRSARDRINAIIEQNRQMKTTTEINHNLPAGWTALPGPSGIYYYNPNATPSSQTNRPGG